MHYLALQISLFYLYHLFFLTVVLVISCFLVFDLISLLAENIFYRIYYFSIILRTVRNFSSSLGYLIVSSISAGVFSPRPEEMCGGKSALTMLFLCFFRECFPAKATSSSVCFYLPSQRMKSLHFLGAFFLPL